MEGLEDKVNKFLAIDVGTGDGDGCGSGKDYDNSGGYGSGSGFSDSSGDGDGKGSGYGSSFDKGFGCGCGKGLGCSYGFDKDFGYGFGSDKGLKKINGKTVYIVDETTTIFTSIRGNIAQGFIVQSDLQLTPCFIVKENNKFAHGSTLRDAFTSLQEKLYDDSTEEERIEAFKKKFPAYDEKYDNKDLFAYHHVLTGSCRMGREEFVKGKGLSLDGKTSVREFVELTKDAYGSYIIKELPKAYGIK